MGGWACRSRYTRFEPVPRVLVTVGPRKREGGEVDFRAGNAGLTGGCENANGSGTANVSKFRRHQVRMVKTYSFDY